MEENVLLGQLADTMTEKPITFRIDLQYPNIIQRILIRLKLAKPYREYEVKPIVLGKMIQISKLMLKIEPNSFDAKGGLREVNKLAVISGEDLAAIVAIAIHPGKTPPGSLYRFLLNNLSMQELKKAASIILTSLKVDHFLSSIVSLYGIQILKETSPVTEEIIASETKASTARLAAL